MLQAAGGHVQGVFSPAAGLDVRRAYCLNISSAGPPSDKLMAEFKFSCPSCSQHIQLDELWAGHQIQCPGCQQTITVPTNPATQAPAPAPSGPRGAPGPPAVPSSTRLSKSAAPSASHGPAPAPQTRFTPGAAAAAKASAKPAQSKVVKIAGIGAGVVALGVGLYFGIPYILSLNDKFAHNTREEAKKSDGGEMGHIANLYNVLDATEPGGRGLSGMPKGHGPRMRPDGNDFPVVPPHATGASVSQPELPALTAIWSLDTVMTNLSQGRAAGKLAGTNFLVEAARVEPVGTAKVLHLLQGSANSADRDLFIYLHLSAGQGLSTQTWTVTKDMTGLGVPEVKKRWKVDPRFAPKLASYKTGYALKLEFGEVTNLAVSGRIYLALPDDEKSVVAGVFNAAILVPSPVAVSQTQPQQFPMRPPPSQQFESRRRRDQ